MLVKRILMITAIVVILVIGFSFIYYYIIFLPKNKQAELEWDKERYYKEEEREKREETNFQECLDKAKDIYTILWNRECKKRALPDGFNLPADVANNLNKYYEDMREDCFIRYKRD